MIIGGQAVLLYGEPRLTRDIDVTLGLEPDALPSLLRFVEDAGLTPLVDPEPFVKETLVLPCADGGTGIRVDFILSFSPYEQEALQRVRKERLGTASVSFASPEDVIIHKIVAGRPRDLEDVQGILAKTPGVDRPYIRRWLHDLGQAIDMPLEATFLDLVREHETPP
jgi:hypothetical protein